VSCRSTAGTTVSGSAARSKLAEVDALRSGLALLLGALACGDDGGSLGPPPPDSASVSIVVHASSPGPAIPPDFLGLGFEMPVMADPHFTSEPVFERLLANLGPGTFRFGGNSVENTYWSPAGRGHRSDWVFELTPADVDATVAVARRIGWRVIIALNLGAFAPDTFAAEAEYVARRAGPTLLGIEIGNEPDLYVSRGLRPPGWDVDSFTTEFEAYAAAIRARAPNAPIVGPATAGTGSGAWFAAFLAKVRSPLAFASHHFYPMGVPAPPGSVEHATVANMLSPELMARTAANIDSAAGPSRAHGLALRLDETNSAYGFGKPGVSDVAASALWGLDYLFTLAERGVVSVNIETGTDIEGGLTCRGIYLPVCRDATGWTARPLYYAMLFFRQAGAGRPVPIELTADASERKVVAHAVRGEDGTLRVAVINKEAATRVEARIEAGTEYAAVRAGAYRLLAPSLEAPGPVTFAGAAVANDGTWHPGAAEPVPGEGGRFIVSVPPASALLLVVGQEPAIALREPLR
jgi:hypothetical protein